MIVLLLKVTEFKDNGTLLFARETGGNGSVLYFRRVKNDVDGV